MVTFVLRLQYIVEGNGGGQDVAADYEESYLRNIEDRAVRFFDLTCSLENMEDFEDVSVSLASAGEGSPPVEVSGWSSVLETCKGAENQAHICLLVTIRSPGTMPPPNSPDDRAHPSPFRDYQSQRLSQQTSAIEPSQALLSAAEPAPVPVQAYERCNCKIQ